MMKKLIARFKSFFCKEMPEPYRSIADLPFDDHGWFPNGDQLKAIIESKSPQTVIEIGSWLGLSTRFIASHLSKDGKVYAVDTWKGSPREAVHMIDPRLPYLYQLFLSNVKHANLTEKIIPVRMDSVEASIALNIKADLIYIDGSHDTYSVINDIMNWHPRLNKGGIMCGDDWRAKTVRGAVEKCGEYLKQKVLATDNFWWYEDAAEKTESA